MNNQWNNPTMEYQEQRNLHIMNRLLWLFIIEGMLYQAVIAINNLGNTIYATNLGASDTQIGLIQTVPNAVAILLMLPVGMFAAKCKSSKTIPILLLLIMGCSYIGFASVPLFGKHVMLFYLFFLGINLGVMGVYNAQWQLFFGDAVGEECRNPIYSKRNQAMYLAGAVIPFLCGLMMFGLHDTSSKIIVLRCFFYLCSAALFVQAILIWKIPQSREKRFTAEKEKRSAPVKLSALRDSFLQILNNKKIFCFFAVMLLFYASWELDWGMWYIGQVQYIGMSESQLSYYNGLASLFQMLSIGIYAKNIEKHGIVPTFMTAVVALIGYPLVMMAAMLLPGGIIRVWPFMILCIVLSVPLGCVNLCVVQLVLKILPENGKEIMMSLYSLLLLLSNCILPLIGVRIYQWLGSNLRALAGFLLIELMLRLCSFAVIKFKWKEEKTT